MPSIPGKIIWNVDFNSSQSHNMAIEGNCDYSVGAQGFTNVFGNKCFDCGLKMSLKISF